MKLCRKMIIWTYTFALLNFATLCSSSKVKIAISDQFAYKSLLPYANSKWFVEYGRSLVGKSAVLKKISQDLWKGTLSESGRLQMPISQLGTYSLATTNDVGNTTDHTFSISLVLCPDDGDSCQNFERGGGCSGGVSKFCIMTTKGGRLETQHCQTLTTEICDTFEKQRICTINRVAFVSICEANINQVANNIVEFKPLTTLNSGPESNCSDNSGAFFVVQQRAALELGSFVLSSAGKLEIHCSRPDLSSLSNSVTLCRSIGDSEIHCANESCNGVLGGRFTAKAGTVITLRVQYGNSSSFVHVVGMPTNISMMKSLIARRLKCSIVDVEKIDGRFRSKWTVYKDNVAIVKENSFNRNMSIIFDSEQNGTYKCTVQIRFRACSPFTEYETHLEKTMQPETTSASTLITKSTTTTMMTQIFGASSETTMDLGLSDEKTTKESSTPLDQDPPKAQSNKADNSKQSSGSSKSTIFIIVGLIIAVTAVGILVFWFYKRGGGGGEKKQPITVKPRSVSESKSIVSKSSTEDKSAICNKSVKSIKKAKQQQPKRTSSQIKTASKKDSHSMRHLTLPPLSTSGPSTWHPKLKP